MPGRNQLWTTNTTLGQIQKSDERFNLLDNFFASCSPEPPKSLRFQSSKICTGAARPVSWQRQLHYRQDTPFTIMHYQPVSYFLLLTVFLKDFSAVCLSVVELFHKVSFAIMHDTAINSSFTHIASRAYVFKKTSVCDYHTTNADFQHETLIEAKFCFLIRLIY